MATIEQFNYFQDRVAFHSLTCGNNSLHALLRPIQDGRVKGGIVLLCPDCAYRQIPAPYLHELVESANQRGEQKP